MWVKRCSLEFKSLSTPSWSSGRILVASKFQMLSLTPLLAKNVFTLFQLMLQYPRESQDALDNGSDNMAELSVTGFQIRVRFLMLSTADWVGVNWLFPGKAETQNTSQITKGDCSSICIGQNFYCSNKTSFFLEKVKLLCFVNIAFVHVNVYQIFNNLFTRK